MWCRCAQRTGEQAADALSVEGWRRGIVHGGAGRVRGASGLSPLSVRTGEGNQATGVVTLARTHSTMDTVVAPGVNIFATPSLSNSAMSSGGMMPPPNTTMSFASRSASS